MKDRCKPAHKLFIGIPAYMGQIDIETMHSLLEGIPLLRDAGCKVTWTILEGCCYLCHARNQIVAEFLATDSTDLLFVDADVGFGFEALARIVGAERPVVAGLYRKKTDTKVDFNLRLPAAVHNCEADGLLEVQGLATGFLRINRAVFDAMKPSTMEYGNGHEGGKKWHNYFRTLYEDGKFWGEDFQFCRDVQTAGFKLHAIPDLTMHHVGKKVYSGNWAEWMASQGAARKREVA